MKGEDLNSLQPKELIMIEEALDNGLTNLNDKLVTTLQSVDLSTIDVRDTIIHGISFFF
jgi:hypothetical protein